MSATPALTDEQIDAAIEALFPNDNHYHAEWMKEIARPLAHAVLAADRAMLSAAPAPPAAASSIQLTDVLVRLKRPEGYEDVHPELVLVDANINPAFEPEIVPALAEALDALEWVHNAEQTTDKRGVMVDMPKAMEHVREVLRAAGRLPADGPGVKGGGDAHQG